MIPSRTERRPTRWEVCDCTNLNIPPLQLKKADRSLSDKPSLRFRLCSVCVRSEEKAYRNSLESWTVGAGCEFFK